jgi:hypothetical protein
LLAEQTATGGSILVRQGKGGGGREVGMDERDEQEQLDPASAIGEAADAVANARVHVAVGLTRRPKSLTDSRGRQQPRLRPVGSPR